MENNIENVDGIGKAISAAVGGLLTYLAGLNWELVIIWFILMCVDIIVGVISANINGEFKSSTMKKGLYLKAMEFFLLFSLTLLQKIAIENGLNVPVSGVFAGAFCFKEVGSIFETTIENGLEVPEIIKKWFDVTNKQINNKGEDN